MELLESEKEGVFMPQVVTEARDGVVYFVDGVGTSDTTYTYPNPQSEFTLQNTGTRRLIWSVGPYTGILVNPGETDTRVIDAGISSFKVRAEYHYQSFSMRTKETPIENPSLDARIASITTPNKTIYVDQSVVSSGDGTQNSPFKTIKEAVDAVASFPNNTKIFIKAGVYKERVVISGRFTYKGGWLTLEGEVDVNSIPLTIVDGIDNDKPNGIYISDGSQVITKNILCRNFRNYTGVTTASGIVVERAKLYTINTHVKDCDYAGINANISGRLLTQGGTIENCRIGIRAYGNSVITVGYGSVSTSIKNCTEAGVLAASHSNGHVDYSVLDGNAVGVKLETISRLHIMLCEIKNANIGVASYNGSTFFDDRNTYTGIAWANQLNYSFSADDSRRDLKSSLYRTLDTSKVTHTGTVAKTAYKKATIPAGTLAYGSSAIRIKVFGKINTLTSQQTATVECSYGATSLYGFVSNGNIDQTYSLTYELMNNGGTTMLIHLLHTQGVTVKTQNTYTAGRNPSTNNDFNVSITLANASDNVTIDGVIIEEIYS